MDGRQLVTAGLVCLAHAAYLEHLVRKCYTLPANHFSAVS